MASIGSYKGIPINAGSDAEVAAQIAKIDGGSGSSAAPTPAPAPKKKTRTDSSSSDPFISELQKKLLSQSDLISSSNTELEDKIGKAISGIEKSSRASAQRIESEFGREIGYAVDEGELTRTGIREAGSGFATNTALLRLVDERTDKSLKDLEQRKQELLLSGEAAAASQISGLQMQEIQFRQASQQQMFSNLLSLGSLGLQISADERAMRSQSFTETSTMSALALQYGVALQPGDTIDTVAARAAPFASEKQQLDLARIRADIARSNAEISKINREAAAGAIQSTDVDALAMAYNQGGQAILSGVKDPNIQAQVINRAAELQKAEGVAAAQSYFDRGLTKNKAIAAVANDTSIAPALKPQVLQAIEKVYAAGGPSKVTPSSQSYSSFGVPIKGEFQIESAADRAARQAKQDELARRLKLY